MTADEAIDALWPDVDAVTGRARLRNLLNRVRSRAADLVERRGDMLVLGHGVEVDAVRFEAAAASALRADADRRAGLARLALDAYGGDLLPGDVYADWAAAPRERLRRRYLALLDVVAVDALSSGDLDEAVRLLDVAIAVEPLGEARYVEAGRALVVQGRRRAAAELVGRALAVLDDLGVAPGPVLAALAEELTGS